MSKRLKTNYAKRTQKDYSMSFTLGVEKEVETGELSVTSAIAEIPWQSK